MQDKYLKGVSSKNLPLLQRSRRLCPFASIIDLDISNGSATDESRDGIRNKSDLR